MLFVNCAKGASRAQLSYVARAEELRLMPAGVHPEKQDFWKEIGLPMPIFHLSALAHLTEINTNCCLN